MQQNIQNSRSRTYERKQCTSSVYLGIAGADASVSGAAQAEMLGMTGRRFRRSAKSNASDAGQRRILSTIGTAANAAGAAQSEMRSMSGRWENRLARSNVCDVLLG